MRIYRQNGGDRKKTKSQSARKMRESGHEREERRELLKTGEKHINIYITEHTMYIRNITYDSVTLDDIYDVKCEHKREANRLQK